MKNLTKRFITGLILVTLIISCIFSGPYSYILLVTTINILAQLEFYRLFQAILIKPSKWLGIIESILILLSVSLMLFHLFDWRILLINIPVPFIIFLSELYRRKKNPFQNIAFTFLGIVYITIPCALLIAIAFLLPETGSYKPILICGCFCIVWASDTGAFFTGKLLGKHKLFLRISPHKTWEGSFGGSAFAFSAAILASNYFDLISIIDWLVIALIITVIGSYGDLIKSLMKRSLHIKDSGTILPGHGGILDRFDSLLSSTPFIFSYLIIIS